MVPEKVGMMFHCCISLDKLLEETLNGIKVLSCGESDTYLLVRKLKQRGYKYFSACDNVDAEGKCAGHENILQEQVG